MHRMRLIGLGSSDAAYLPSPESGHGQDDLFRAHGPILLLILSVSLLPLQWPMKLCSEVPARHALGQAGCGPIWSQDIWGPRGLKTWHSEYVYLLPSM